MDDLHRILERLTRETSATRIATDMASYKLGMEMVLRVIHAVPRHWRVLLVLPSMSHYAIFWAPLDGALFPGDTLCVKKRKCTRIPSASSYATKPDIVFINSAVSPRFQWDLIVFACPAMARPRGCPNTSHLITVDLMHDTTPIRRKGVMDVRRLSDIVPGRRMWTLYNHPCAIQCAQLDPKQWPDTQLANSRLGAAKTSSLHTLRRFLLDMVVREKAVGSTGVAAQYIDYNAPVGYVPGVRIVVVFSDPTIMYTVSTPLALHAIPMAEITGDTLTPTNVRELSTGRINVVFVHHSFKDLAALVTDADSVIIADSLVSSMVICDLHTAALYKPVMLWRVDTRDAHGKPLFVEGPITAQYFMAEKSTTEPNPAGLKGEEAESAKAEGEAKFAKAEVAKGEEAESAEAEGEAKVEKVKGDIYCEEELCVECNTPVENWGVEDVMDEGMWEVQDLTNETGAYVADPEGVCLLVEGVTLDLATVNLAQLADLAHLGVQYKLWYKDTDTPGAWLAGFVVHTIMKSVTWEQRYSAPTGIISRAAAAPLWSALCHGRPVSLSPVDWSALTTLLLCQMVMEVRIHISRDAQGEPWMASLEGPDGIPVPIYGFYNSAALRAPAPPCLIPIN